ncbi:Intraflagellar transport protein 80 [Lobulomyces angularis]|nr:Intraflagellar transport protein 80 [Lobulomyces angularis]
MSKLSKIKINSYIKHTECTTSIGWSGNSELYSVGDDQKILKWSSDGELLAPFQTSLFDKSGDPNSPSLFLTELHWFPATPGKSQTNSEIFVVGGSDGKFYLLARSGRVEKKVEAHKGAILALKWSYEGSALLTAGEDGQIKIWSRAGMLRSCLTQSAFPVYSAVWSPENDQILYSSGKNLVIKPIQPSTKPTQWKAHEGIVLKVDWNLANNLIVSGGEDRRYKVWDTYGRQLYSSILHDQPITSVAWNPSGDMFAIGSFNCLRICDKLGWSYALTEPDSGSIFNISWTPDGTQLACAGGNGAVVMGHLINRRLEWKNYEVTILDDKKVLVYDISIAATETLEFRDRIIKASIAFNHLIVCTPSQCYIYSDKNWNTPAITDLNPGGRVVCIKQCAEYFVIVDTIVGMHVYTYEGRPVSQIKYLGLRPEYVTQHSISISGDTLAIKDRTDEKSIYLFDVTTGTPLASVSGGGPFRHSIEVMELALNQSSLIGATSGINGRQLVIVDKNRDMWITGLIKVNFKKLGTMVDTFSWNDEIDIIAAMVDGKFTVWYYPNAVFIDQDIAHLTKIERDGSTFGRDAQFVSFSGTQCTLRKSDGSLVTVSFISPFPSLLHEQTKKKQWEDAIRLCRYAKMNELWACLAVMAVAGQDLNTAEVAYASIQELAKVQYICYIRDIPSAEARTAELALLRRQPKEAENILISANLIYRALKMWMNLYQWDRALELAVKFKSHVDTVLYCRKKYLKSMDKTEFNKRFLQFNNDPGFEIVEEKILEKISFEEGKERNGKS